MTIVFYSSNESKIYICSPTEKTKIVEMNDPNLINLIPNDDILYVTDGHYMSKLQFISYISGENKFETTHNGNQQTSPSNRVPRKYIRATSAGTVLIEDISCVKYPEGLRLNGKWDFIDVEDVGEDVLEDSRFFQIALKKGKVQYVDQDFVEANKHRASSLSSPTDRSLDKLYLPKGVKAMDFSNDWGSNDGAAFTINVD